ncbi:MAG TPA: Co2+/Mg2+ efflux protein ApaG [Myxococcota bacterium]|nr:Co2+/Mg2+ efflux protein ApaG [Myxococcota bacterium]
MSSSEITTHGVHVRAEPQHRPDLSEPGRWVFQYTIHITNLNDRPVRLLARHWIITDGHGHVEHVRGAGVVGEQPRLAPGATHSYSSGCPLPTSIGQMEGSYLMTWDDGATFEVAVAPFALVVEDLLN